MMTIVATHPDVPIDMYCLVVSQHYSGPQHVRLVWSEKTSYRVTKSGSRLAMSSTSSRFNKCSTTQIG
ncbi:hypothetical protein EG68_04826 [Paragonimus skrjabini miyazakii]|uniref:Uncharacterized protein n=1 Tax=Paragonimus skrjabini miyazakii TaxID=59628 RepID=A0A8S9YYD5_9TREM|nr:hypothetical protein EG68_04826 [Paragonimus skrjabini miyazakii]